MQQRRIASVSWSGEIKIDQALRARAEEAIEHAFRSDQSIRSAVVDLEFLPSNGGHEPACRIVYARILGAPGERAPGPEAMAKVTGALRRCGMVATGLPGREES